MSAPTTADDRAAKPAGADEARRTLLLSLADDELVSGHRASHWTGMAPGLEEDLAFSTLAQDEINHADLWYQVLLTGSGGAQVQQDERGAVDDLALGREPDAYRHAVLCERPPGDFAYTLARHWCYDRFDDVRLRALTGSSDADIAAVATKLRHEERYHLEHATFWFQRLVHGGEEARRQLADGLRRVLPEALWLFEPLPGEDRIVAEGLLPSFTAALLREWLDDVARALEDADLLEVLPESVTRGDEGWGVTGDLFAEPGGRHGIHSDDFVDDVWPEMTRLHREHPGAVW